MMIYEHDSGERDPQIRIYVSGEFRRIPRSWWHEMHGPLPPFNFVNDGCTLSPDYSLADGYAIWPACVIHDWHYRYGPSFKMSRWKADWYFMKNVHRLMRLQGAGRIRSAAVAGLYWQGVRRFGGGHYDGG